MGPHLDIADEGKGTSEEVGDGEAPAMVLRPAGWLVECLRRTSSQETAGRRARGQHRRDVGLQQPEDVIPKPETERTRLDWDWSGGEVMTGSVRARYLARAAYYVP